MLTLVENKEKVKRYNQSMLDLKKEHTEMADIFKPITDLSDVFTSYKEFVASVIETKLIPDTATDFSGFYVVGDPNVHHRIEWLTDCHVVDSLFDYGTADNASQILSNVKLPDNSIVLMWPVFKEDQPEEFGWRWHKWGQYLGVQEPQCEYIADEPGIEMVYAFQVVLLEPV